MFVLLLPSFRNGETVDHKVSVIVCKERDRVRPEFDAGLPEVSLFYCINICAGVRVMVLKEIPSLRLKANGC
jgi:hypothetical protein